MADEYIWLDPEGSSRNRPNVLPTIKEGVYFVDNKPYFIVDDYSITSGYLQQTIPFVACFEIDKRSLDTYKISKNLKDLQKAYIQKKVVKKPFGITPRTPLAKLAEDRTEDVKVILHQVRKPLFVAVQHMGKDTFTDNYGLGFNEHTPTVRTMIQGKPVITQAGAPTGVFITLQSISWYRDYVPNSLIFQVLEDESQSFLNFLDENGVPLGTIDEDG